MWALIDSGSQENYISGAAVLKAGLQPVLKKTSYKITVANGSNGGLITHEVCEESSVRSVGHSDFV